MAETSKSSVEFLFMRHAESQDNLQHIVPLTAGCKGLTDRGFEQAKKAAAHLKGIRNAPGIIVASPLLRARQTAQIVSDALGLDVFFSEILQEQNLGAWEGKPWSDVMPFLEERVLPPAGETYDQFSERMDKVVSYLAELSVNKPLIIAHGGIWYGLSTRYSPNTLMMPLNAEIRRVSLNSNVLTYTREFSTKNGND